MLEGIRKWNIKEFDRLNKEKTNVDFLNAYITRHNNNVRSAWRRKNYNQSAGDTRKPY